MLNNVSEIVTALATITAASTAIYGVREWKRQMKGKTDYEIARCYLKAALVLRDAMEYVRNPFITLNEMQLALKEQGFESKEYTDKAKTNQAVYSTRWKKVQEAWTSLDAELLEAEVSWGKGAIKVSTGLTASTRKLFAALQMYISGERKKIQDELIYNQGTMDNPDAFSLEVSKSIDEIREFLRPHLL
jgi:hypothetical protein